MDPSLQEEENIEHAYIVTKQPHALIEQQTIEQQEHGGISNDDKVQLSNETFAQKFEIQNPKNY